MILISLGLMLIALGLIILLWPESRRDHEERSHQERDEKKAERREMKGGAIIMIGPIPIVIGSDSGTALLMMIIALAIMLIWILVFMRW